MSKRQNPELHKEWDCQVALYRTSGLTQTKWCEINEISVHQLKYWLKKLDNPHSTQESDNKWISVALEETDEQLNEAIQIKVGSVSIEVKPGFNPSLLADVVKDLNSVC